MVSGESVPSREVGEGVGGDRNKPDDTASKFNIRKRKEPTTAGPWLGEETEEGRHSPFPFQRTSRWPPVALYYPFPPIKPIFCQSLPPHA